MKQRLTYCDGAIRSALLSNEINTKRPTRAKRCTAYVNEQRSVRTQAALVLRSEFMGMTGFLYEELDVVEALHHAKPLRQ